MDPVPPARLLVVGADGQLGKALRKELADANVEWATRADFDLAGSELHASRRWHDYSVIINAAAYTAVDRAEASEGRRDAWSVNATGPGVLARIASDFGITLIHVSSDYVFDGASERPYREDDAFSPLGVYGQSKAAGDIAVATTPAHYIVRTSWVIGEGKNFVRTMASLAERGIDPMVVDDQRGRLTFASEIARFIRHLLAETPPYGTYNLTSDGETMTWADIARDVFELGGHDPARVAGVSTEAYFVDSTGAIAPRPRNSVLDLSRAAATGFVPADGRDQLRKYLVQ